MEDLRKGRCPLCGHNEVLESSVLVVVPWDMSHTGRDRTLPVRVTAPQQETFVEAFRRALHGSDRRPNGHVALYACRSCGYAQMFVVDAADVPVGAEHGTRLVRGVDVEGPYR